MSLLKRIESAGAAAAKPSGVGAAPPLPDAPPEGAIAPRPSITSTAPSVAVQPVVAPRSGGVGAMVSPSKDRTLQINRDLKSRVEAKLISELDPTMDLTRKDEVRLRLQNLFDQIVETEGVILTRAERQRLFEELSSDVIGFGPIEPLLQDSTVSEVMVNGPHKVYIERRGKLVLSDVEFEDDEHLRRIIDRIVSPLGRHVDESSPICDARLPDGSRVNIVIPPISLIGPVITIRKFSKTPLTVDDLIRSGSLTRETMEFLRACVTSRLNCVVSGGTGSGKTT